MSHEPRRNGVDPQPFRWEIVRSRTGTDEPRFVHAWSYVASAEEAHAVLDALLAKYATFGVCGQISRVKEDGSGWTVVKTLYPPAECIGGPHDGETLPVMESSSTIQCVDSTGQHSGVYRVDSGAVPPVYRWERADNGVRMVPLAVALAFVTGRRVDPAEYYDVFRVLYEELSEGLDTHTSRAMEEFRRRAAAAFPAIARETGRELDERPCRCIAGNRPPGNYMCRDCLNAWLAARIRIYGSMIAMLDWRGA